MAFPQTQLPVTVEIAPGAEPADDPNNWQWLGLWTDITSDVRVEQGITIEQGRGDEANQVDPGTCTLVIDNRSGNYSPKNPVGQWYGALSKGTPLRVKLRRLTETFTRTVGAGSWGTSDNGITWSSPLSVFSVNGTKGVVTLPENSSVGNTAVGASSWDFEMRCEVSTNAVPVAANMNQIINFRRNGSTNMYSLTIQYNPAGTIDLFLDRTLSGVTVNLNSAGTVLAGYTANTSISVYLKVSGGFIGAKVWYTATGSEPSAWTISDSAQGDYGLENTTLGTFINLQVTRFTGNTNGTAATWDNVIIDAPLFVGTVSEWPVRWDKSGNDSTAPIQACGVLRRLQQGQSPLNSPLFQTIYGQDPKPIAFWPLEDTSGSTSGVGLGTNVKPASVFGASFGFDTTTDPQLPGASSTVTITQDTTISGLIPQATLIGSGWLWTMAIYTPAWPPGTSVAVPVRLRGSGSAVTWQMQFTNQLGGQIYAVGFDADGNTLANVSVAATNFTPGAWHMVQLESWQNGGNVSNLLRTWNLTTGAIVATSTISFAGSVGQPNSWSVYGNSTTFPTGSVGMIGWYNRRSVFVDTAVLAAGRGYVGETAAERIARLCGEQGVRIDIVDNTADRTTVMGRQTSDTFLSIIREAERTDLGVLSEFDAGLRYRSRDRRYNQKARLNLDFATGHIAEPPEPIDDDQRLRNDWTVNRKEGSTARVEDSVNVAMNGRYDDSIEINPASDDQLDDHAAFRVYLGTFDDLRWPTISIDLSHNPELLERYMALEVGVAITVANPPHNLPVGTLQLVVEGWKQVLTPFGWTVEMNCSSNVPWNLPPLDDAGLRLDSDDSFLNASVTTTGTSLAVIHPAGSAYWDTTAVPFAIAVGGEEMTVTAISGTGTTQTFTVTRSVNGIVKAQSAGAPVTLYAPSYVAL